MPATNIPLLLEPQQLQALLADSSAALCVVDLCTPERYPAGHIPGAVYLHPGQLQRGTAPAPGKIPEAPQLAEIFSALGLTPDTHVVAYDDEGGGWAGRLLWTLEAIGHSHYSYLNGGIHAWAAAGLSLESTPVEPTPSDYPVTIRGDSIADIDDILPRLDDPGLAIWDARSAAEYRGERTGSSRAGHIPGAVNIDWLELIDRGNDMRLVDLEALRARLESQGLGADKDIVTHCQTHHRSSLSWLVMKILGYPSARGYHGSWGEWGNRDDTPIEH